MRYDVTSFGVVGDGKTNNTDAIKSLTEKITAIQLLIMKKYNRRKYL